MTIDFKGEFVVMNYRITGEFQAPFRIYPFIDELSNYKVKKKHSIIQYFSCN